MWRVAIGIVLWLGVACSAPPPPATPAPVPTPPPPATPALVATPPPTATLPAPTPRPPVAATPTSAPAIAAAALPTVETSAPALGPAFLTPVELELELQQPLTDPEQLRLLVEGVQELNGIASVRSDGVRIRMHYDSTRVLPARIRERLRELGHPAKAGTEVQNPGDAAD
jgi:hypothetical protein